MKRMKNMPLFILSLFFTGIAHASDFSISSPQVHSGKPITEKQVFNGFGCSGENISPELNWENSPKETKSFAVTVYDPDAPTGSGWWHWVVFNIPAKANQLALDAGNTAKELAPKGSVQSRTDFGKTGYGGPCPPKGNNPHRYHFTVYALDIDKLPLDKNSPAAMVGFYINSHVIEKAELKAHFSR